MFVNCSSLDLMEVRVLLLTTALVNVRLLGVGVVRVGWSWDLAKAPATSVDGLAAYQPLHGGYRAMALKQMFFR